MNVLEQFQDKFKVNEYKVYETNYWIWSLRPHQATIGSGILSLKRECANFSELKSEEFKDLNNIIKVIEPTLKSAFNYNVINYLMLMMVDKHVHYHVIPRYERKIIIFEETWEDKAWPSMPILRGDSCGIKKLSQIKKYIKNQ